MNVVRSVEQMANFTTPEVHTITKSENIGASSSITCVTFGKICLIQMSISVNSNAPTNAELFSGAPAPKSGVGAYACVAGTGKSLAVSINSNGKGIVEGTPGSNTGWMNGEFVYATN